MERKARFFGGDCWEGKSNSYGQLSRWLSGNRLLALGWHWAGTGLALGAKWMLAGLGYERKQEIERRLEQLTSE